jgi:cytochrome c5
LTLRSQLSLLAVPLALAVAVFAQDSASPDAKLLLQDSCTSCHSLDVLQGKHWSKPHWQAVVDNMVQRGASLKTSDSAILIDYLSKTFGEDPGQRLVEDICSLCHEWQRIKDHPQTKEQWSGTIKGMIVEGAPVTEEEFQLIVNYLAKNYGPEPRP